MTLAPKREEELQLSTPQPTSFSCLFPLHIPTLYGGDDKPRFREPTHLTHLDARRGARAATSFEILR